MMNGNDDGKVDKNEGNSEFEPKTWYYQYQSNLVTKVQAQLKSHPRNLIDMTVKELDTNEVTTGYIVCKCKQNTSYMMHMF